MLNRYGTRLDLGTAEDIAELNNVEELLRFSARRTTAVDHSGAGAVRSGTRGRFRGTIGVSGPVYQTHAASSVPGQSRASRSHAYSGGGVRSVETAGAGSGAIHATVATDASDPVAGLRRNSVGLPYGTAAAGGVAAPPHVDLGYSAGHRSSGGTSTTTTGHALTAPSAGGYTQRTAYGDETVRSEGRSPSGRPTGTVSGMRATAPPFYRPQITMEGTMYRPGTAGASRAEDEESRAKSGEAAELQSDIEHRRSSMRGGYSPSATATAPFPGPAITGFGGPPTRLQQPQYTQAPPYAYHAPQNSVVSAHAGAVRGNRRGGQGERGDDDDEDDGSEGAPARPSRVSGRYHFS
ncbi:hypothetical protein JKF63_06114 [Porcisia hertigi]|uniref:Uncharacterized protein n=1 Tax=Porcisia hertigi TaxID=2761500 RepID=A0A836LH00_9TRYP|nr:hypothetical protein JKF63_06114 [Porcisia hertigi]